jgi:hypothetical protein
MINTDVNANRTFSHLFLIMLFPLRLVVVLPGMGSSTRPSLPETDGRSPSSYQKTTIEDGV